jgi:hypothetical protein
LGIIQEVLQSQECLQESPNESPIIYQDDNSHDSASEANELTNFDEETMGGIPVPSLQDCTVAYNMHLSDA